MMHLANFVFRVKMLFDQFFPQYRRDGHLMLKTIIVIAIAYVSSSNSRTVFVRENSPAGES